MKSVLMRPIAGMVAGMSVLVCLNIAAAFEQRTDVFVASINHPAIAYTTAPVHDAVAELDARL